MTYKSRAIVLKSYAWPRNARLYVLYTERFGKVKAVASGVQKVTSKVAGHLQPFSITEAMIAQGRKFDRLAQARFMRGFTGVHRDFLSFAQGSYVLEILDHLTSEGVADQAIWDYTLEVFDQLNEQSAWADEADIDLQEKKTYLTRLYALRLLNHFGFGPELYECLHCRNELQPDELHLSVLQSGMLCGACGPTSTDTMRVSVDLLKMLRAARNQPLRDAAKISVAPDIRAQCGQIIDELMMLQTQRSLRTAVFAPVKKAPSFV